MIDSQSFPEYPGLYLVKDSQEKLIFAGMTVNLRRRIAALFEEVPVPPRDLELMNSRNFKKIPQMVVRAASVEVLLLESEAQRVCLTNRLIERHRPLFNPATFLDVTGYAYIRQTDEPFARLVIGGQMPGWQGKPKRKKGTVDHQGITYGPFPTGPARTLFLKCLNEALELRTCDPLQGRACALYAAGKCSAPCEGHISPLEYGTRLDQAHAYLENPAAFLDFLEARMQAAAQEMQFERASLLRDELKTLRSAFARMQPAPFAESDQDVIYAEQGIGIILHLRRGWLDDFWFIEAHGDVPSFLLPILPGSCAVEVIVPEDWNAAMLAEKMGRKITSPETPLAREMMECARRNVMFRRRQFV